MNKANFKRIVLPIIATYGGSSFILTYASGFAFIKLDLAESDTLKIRTLLEEMKGSQ